MSFADLEQRANASVMRRMSNARALRVGDAQDFPVVFDRAHVDTGTGVSANTPLATALDSDIAGFAPNVHQLVIRGVTYLIRDVQPDGTGMSLMVLEDV